MLMIFYSLLMLILGRCADKLISETKTVGVGDDVFLNCTRQKSSQARLFWTRLVSGSLPEVLGATFAFDSAYDANVDAIEQTLHITTKQHRETFILHINKTKLNDTGFYYCIKVESLSMTFLKRTFLRFKGTETYVTSVIQVPPSDSVTMQCSVHSEHKTCPGDHSVYWFKAGSNDPHPRVIHTHGNSDDDSRDAHISQECVHNLSKKISSSDAGDHSCAVVTCGEILFGNLTKLDIQALSMWDLTKANSAIFLLSVTLAASLIFIAYLIYTTKIKSCGCCHAACFVKTNAATSNGDQKSQQGDGNSLIYSETTLNERKAVRAERQNVKTAIYTTTAIYYCDVRI